MSQDPLMVKIYEIEYEHNNYHYLKSKSKVQKETFYKLYPNEKSLTS